MLQESNCRTVGLWLDLGAEVVEDRGFLLAGLRCLVLSFGLLVAPLSR